MALKTTIVAGVTSWKTTALGFGTLVVTLWATVVSPWLAGGPFDIRPFLTQENLTAAVGLIVGVGLLLVRDADKTSEKSGVAPVEPPVSPATEDVIAERFGEK